MTLQDIGLDAASIARAFAAITELWHVANAWVSPYYSAITFILVVLLIIVMNEYGLIGLRRTSSAGKKLWALGKRFVMRRGKDGNVLLTQEQIASELQDSIIEKVETLFDAGKISRKDANHIYATQAKHFPSLRYAIHEPDTTAERITEAQLNREREADGTVIRLPLPGEVPTKKKHVVRSSH